MEEVHDEPGVHGWLRVFRRGGGGRDGDSVRGRTLFVNGPGYDGMEDNDIRGFLDGRYYNGWNQPSQTHVRVGRVGRWAGSSVPEGRSPVFGEPELFRTLLRWQGIRLPPGATVERSSLALTVEMGCTEDVRMLLYAVRRDWDPGQGGVHGNDVSAPTPGEVWWNYASHERVPWGSPGAGRASRADPEADTDPMPLAQAVYRPGDEEVVFASKRLADHLEEISARGGELRLLLKASDHVEDIPGMQLAFFSGDYGSRRNPRRRPRLAVEWETTGVELMLEEEVILEAGRSLVLPPVNAADDKGLYITFHREDVSTPPSLFTRSAEGGAGGEPWRRIRGDERSLPDEPFEIRVVAARDPVSLGTEFRDGLRHPWVTSGIPEDGRVRWVFTSPTGQEHRSPGIYEGDYTWSVTFEPWEPGVWRYWWEHELTGKPERGPGGRFTVRAEASQPIREALDRLAVELVESGLDRHAVERDPFRIRFSRLVREAARLESEAAGAGGELEDLLPKLDEVRSVVWGRPLPEPFPLRSLPIREVVDGRPLPDPVPDLSDDRTGGFERMLRRVRRRIAGLRRSLPGRSS